MAQIPGTQRDCESDRYLFEEPELIVASVTIHLLSLCIYAALARTAQFFAAIHFDVSA